MNKGKAEGTFSSLFFFIQLSCVIHDKIAALLKGRFQEDDLNDCYLVDTVISKNSNRVRVFVDSDSSLTLARCQRISRFLEAILEEENLVPERYTMEVSSPGIEKPLKFRRQYTKNIGRAFEVTTHDKEKFKGKLIEVLEDKILLEIELSKKQAKKTGIKTEQVEIPFENIENSIVKISFKKS